MTLLRPLIGLLLTSFRSLKPVHSTCRQQRLHRGGQAEVRQAHGRRAVRGLELPQERAERWRHVFGRGGRGGRAKRLEWEAHGGPKRKARQRSCIPVERKGGCTEDARAQDARILGLRIRLVPSIVIATTAPTPSIVSAPYDFSAGLTPGLVSFSI